MKSKTMILMAVAVVCGLAASYMTSRLLADRTEKIPVLVAKDRIAGGTIIKTPEDQFEIQEFDKKDVPRNAVVRLEALKDQWLMKALAKGEVVSSENILDKNKIGLEGLLPLGKRAVAVRTTAEKVAGGFVLPGSHVDVIHTSRANGQREPEARVILQNILVRAVDQQPLKPDDKPGMVPATVTLEVTPQQALGLAQVQDSGSLTLSLRAFGDHEEQNLDPPRPKAPVKVVEKPVEAPKPPPVVRRPPPDKNVLTIQNGSRWTRATYLTQDGETHTTIEHSQSEVESAPSAASVAAPPSNARGNAGF